MKVRLVNKNITENYTFELLKERGVKEPRDLLYGALNEPDLLDNIEAGARLVEQFIDNNSGRIGTILDSDMDGFTSAAILYLYLKKYAPNLEIDYYIHEAKQHGFEDVWDKMVDKNYDLLIIADAATNDAKYIEQFNCPVLVIDHHEYEGGGIASNTILINNQTSPNYPNKDLSGAGLALQFCRYLDKIRGTDGAMYFADLAAAGVDGDMMSGLQPENQALWRYGFKHINNPFLKAIIEKQSYSMNGKITPISVAFYIVPLINAMVRVGTAEEKDRMFQAFINGLELIPSGKRGAKGELDTRANESARECVNARSRQNRLLEDITNKLEQKIFKHDLLENQILFIRLDDDDDFPSVLNGLCAMRLAATYKKPTIIARLNEEGYIRGSLRGVNSSELTSFKDYLSDTGLFEYTAGHANAAGISILASNLEELHRRANVDLAKYDFGEQCFDVNFKRSGHATDLADLITDITNYDYIWSQKNEEPLIYVYSLVVPAHSIQVIGKNKDTLKFEKNGVTFIKFHANELIEKIKQFKDTIDFEIVGRANMNEFMGHCAPQLFIDDYEVRDGALSF